MDGNTNGSYLTDSSILISVWALDKNSIMNCKSTTTLGFTDGILNFWTLGVFITACSVFGILGNVLSICVLSLSKMRNLCSFFLICLALCDVVSLVGATLIFGIPSLLRYSPKCRNEFINGSLIELNSNFVSYANTVRYMSYILPLSTTGNFHAFVLSHYGLKTGSRRSFTSRWFQKHFKKLLCSNRCDHRIKKSP